MCTQASHVWQEAAGQSSSLAALKAAADTAAAQAAAQRSELQSAASKAAADLQVCLSSIATLMCASVCACHNGQSLWLITVRCSWPKMFLFDSSMEIYNTAAAAQSVFT